MNHIGEKIKRFVWSVASLIIIAEHCESFEKNFNVRSSYRVVSSFADTEDEYDRTLWFSFQGNHEQIRFKSCRGTIFIICSETNGRESTPRTITVKIRKWEGYNNENKYDAK